MSKNILVADDSTTIQKTIAISLANQGFQLMFASSGSDALAKAKGGQVDMVLLDASMPDRNGLDLCKELRSLPQLKATPIVMLTSAQGGVDEAQIKAAGGSDFLIKPFESKVLMDKVSNIFSTPSKPHADLGAAQTIMKQEPYAPAPPPRPSAPTPSFMAESTGDLDFEFDSTLDMPGAALGSLGLEDNTEPLPKGPSVSPSMPNTDLSFDTVPPSSTLDNDDLWDFSDEALQAHTAKAEPSPIPEIAADSFSLDDDSLSSTPFEQTFDLGESSDLALGAEIPLAEASSIDDPGFDLDDSDFQPIADHTEVSPKTLYEEPAMVYNETSGPSQAAPSSSAITLSDSQIETIVTKVFQNVIERIAWEVVPDLAEKIIKEEIERLLKDRN